MLDTKLFEFADVYCANDYIMAREERSLEEVLNYIENTNLRVDTLVLKPKTNQLRFMLLPCKANKQLTEVFNLSNPPLSFLRRLWNLDVPALHNALTQYMVQSDIKYQYDNLGEEEKTWLTATILGSKEE